MEYIIDLPKDTKLEAFKSMLDRYQDYKSCIREIKINTLLGKKCQYDVTSIDPPLFCDFSPNGLTSLHDSAISVNNMSFVIGEDLTIISLKIDFKILETKIGNIIGELLSYGCDLKIKPKIYGKFEDFTISNEALTIIGFYIDNESCSMYIS